MVDNRRIAKNAIMLYIRMFISLCIGLYTSRVVLNTLGIEDYGIYNIVGGIVAMFSFLNITMSGATSRFLTYELGRNKEGNLCKVFSSAMIIHILIFLIILLLSETIGLWFLRNKIIIPESRISAALILYQFSIFSIAFSILQVPYTAMLIAYEKMDVYAYIEILCVIMKLVIVFLLVESSFDKLLSYGFLLLIVSVIIFGTYRVYCCKTFENCRLFLKWDKSLIIPMLRYSSWNLYGNMSVMARTQGVNILLNLFFGPILNAASGIASQVQTAVMSFASNVLMAFKPQIIKSYACGNILSVVSLINIGIKISFALLLLLSLPLILEMPFILHLWLKKIPYYATSFCILTLIFNFCASMSSVIVTGIEATGHIKRPSFVNGTLYLLVIPVSYIFYVCGAEPWIAFLINVVMVMIGLFSNVWTLRLLIPEFSIRNFAVNVFLPCLYTLFFPLVLGYIIIYFFSEGWGRFILVLFSTSIFSLLGIIFFLLDRNQRFLLKKQMLIKINSLSHG